jgi:hypothetical protein
MSRFTRVLPLLSVGLVVLASCRDEYIPTEPEGEGPDAANAPSFDLRGVESDQVRPHEAQFHKIAEQVPGFGGYYYDEEGTLVAYLADPEQEKLALEVLSPILKERDLSARERNSGAIEFRKAQFSFPELAAYRDRASSPVLNVRGVEWTDLDEAQNRFVVGVSSDNAREEVMKVLSEYRVPVEAALFEESSRASEDLTLRDRSRPIEGGFQIERFHVVL